MTVEKQMEWLAEFGDVFVSGYDVYDGTGMVTWWTVILHCSYLTETGPEFDLIESHHQSIGHALQNVMDQFTAKHRSEIKNRNWWR